MGKMTVYHGSYVEIAQPKIIAGPYTKDFGAGFYCTLIKEQAQRWARRFDTPTVSVYDVSLNVSLNVLEFKEMSEEWLDFVVDCRYGKVHNYDIVIGAMADDQVYNFVEDYVEGIVTREQFWSLARFKYPTHQINFCTEEALRCLEFRKVEGV